MNDHETGTTSAPASAPAPEQHVALSAEQPSSAAVQPAPATYAMTPAAGQPGPYGYGQRIPDGPIGKSRSFAKVLLLSIVTLGFYQLYWVYAVHDDMKRHSGEGLGGGLALILSLFFGIITGFMLPKEIGDLYAARGWKEPVSGSTGLWEWPGCFILIGPFVWLYKCTTAINDYWAAVAQERGVPVRV